MKYSVWTLQCRRCRQTQVRSLGWEDPLEEGMATHSSILARKIPWTEEHGRLRFMESQRVRHDWSNWSNVHMHFDVAIIKNKVPITFNITFIPRITSHQLHISWWNTLHYHHYGYGLIFLWWKHFIPPIFFVFHYRNDFILSFLLLHY